MGKVEFRRKYVQVSGCFVYHACMHASALDLSETVTLHTPGPLQIDGAKDDSIVRAKAIMVYLLARAFRPVINLLVPLFFYHDTRCPQHVGHETPRTLAL